MQVGDPARLGQASSATDVGVKRHALAADELITAIHLPRFAGPQQFAKVGARNAMVIAVCSFAIALHPDTRSAGTGIGSAGPTPLRAAAAEEYLADTLPWDDPVPLAEAVLRDFGALVAAALGCDPAAIERALHDIGRKRATTRYLHLPPLLAGAVPEVEAPVPAASD